MAATFNFNISTLQLQKSNFLGQTQLIPNNNLKSITPKFQTITQSPVSAKFNLSEILGGRGLCNGEQGIEKELKRNITDDDNTSQTKSQQQESPKTGEESFPEDAFEKEMLGFTGGFPGGEKGLQKFIQENPPPPPSSSSGSSGMMMMMKKARPPDLPMLLPGMIAIVKNPNSPYYMYCGIVQRISDGKAGVLFEGGNWDRLISFRLDELERREKGPPMANPKSAVLETMVEKASE